MRNSTFYVTLILFCFFQASLAQTPPMWGGNPRYTVKVEMLNNKPAIKWNFTYYYDWSQKAERYEHEAQADEMCVLPLTPFKKEGIPCEITFANDGWSYIAFPTHNFCCKCSKSFGAINYDWLKDNSTYIGIETVAGRAVTHWTKQGLYMNNYYSTVDKQLPVRFFEIKEGNPKSWDFDLTTYTTAPIDPDKFKPQCTTQCAGECALIRERDEANMKTE